jgi:DnaK suppressor protein
MADIAAAQSVLEEERTKLIHQLDELGATESGELRSDTLTQESFADAGSMTAERTELLGIAESLATQLAEVNDALVRISEGSYGTCQRCGEAIEKARLEFRPQSVQCVDCKAKSASV